MRDEDRFHDQCGLFGIYGHPEAAKLAYLGLYALQHRGQESAGIVSTDGERLHAEVGMGLVADVFNEERLARLRGSAAIGHNRYSTSGSNLPKNTQPILGSYAQGALALGHNGNLTNAPALRQQLESQGALFRSDMDSEVVVHLIAQSREGRFADRVVHALRPLQGAYSLLILNERELFGVRDPFGFRPLVVGRLGDAWVLASETCALDLIEARFVREVEPGEMVVIDGDGLRSHQPLRAPRVAQCIFEHIYLARPDSRIFGHNVYEVRLRLGERLAREAPAD
ncbi:MAG: amidophosphoribosyltransferase, partial [Nitrospinota bacterium]